MTVVVAFHCSDGVVIAADSMLTTSVGGINVAHYNGRKVKVLQGNQVFAYAGDQGQGQRFEIMADGSHANIGAVGHPIDYGILLAHSLVQQFSHTGAAQVGINTALAFAHNGQHHCCMFEGDRIQPRLLDADHFFMSLGSGKLSADPFLRFIVDTFCPNGPPTVREAIFLATWVIEHVITTNPGGVAAPIRVAILEQSAGGFEARDVPDEEIQEHRAAVESATDALRQWRFDIQSGEAADDASPLPKPPAGHEIRKRPL